MVKEGKKAKSFVENCGKEQLLFRYKRETEYLGGEGGSRWRGDGGISPSPPDTGITMKTNMLLNAFDGAAIRLLAVNQPVAVVIETVAAILRNVGIRFGISADVSIPHRNDVKGA